MNRLASSDGDVAETVPSNDAAGEESNADLAEKEEQTARTNNMTLLPDGIMDMNIGAHEQNVTVSVEEVSPDVLDRRLISSTMSMIHLSFQSQYICRSRGNHR
jgi:hypothetical protein